MNSFFSHACIRSRKTVQGNTAKAGLGKYYEENYKWRSGEKLLECVQCV